MRTLFRLVRLALIVGVTGCLLAGTFVLIAPYAHRVVVANSSTDEEIDLAQLNNFAVRSYVYAADGTLLSTLHGPENRQPVPLSAVPDTVKEERWHRFMQRQQAISARRLRRKVGTRQQVLIDQAGPTVAKGRSRGDAPEIDGTVHVASRRPLRVGEIATVRIERADDYDLHGTAVGF